MIYLVILYIISLAQKYDFIFIKSDVNKKIGFRLLRTYYYYYN